MFNYSISAIKQATVTVVTQRKLNDKFFFELKTYGLQSNVIVKPFKHKTK